MITRTKLLMYASGLVTAIAVAGASYSIARTTPTKQEREPIYSPPTRPAVANSEAQRDLIGAVGLIEAASEPIAVGSTAAGVVTSVPVRPGDRVAKGDILWVIDDRIVAADLLAAREDLRTAEEKLRETEAQVGPAQARVAIGEAAVRLAQLEQENQQLQFQRIDAIRQKGAVSVDEWSQRKFSLESAKARLASAEAQLLEERAKLALLVVTSQDSPNECRPGPTVEVQRSAVAKAKAVLAQAEARLALHTIRAHTPATVLQVRVRPGEFVPTAVLTDPLMVVGVTTPLHVRVEIDEAEIGRFYPQGQATASLRGKPENRVKLTFVRVEPLVSPKRVLTGGSSERVDTRVMQVIYSLDPTALSAQVGQQMDVYIEGLVSPASR